MEEKEGIRDIWLDERHKIKILRQLLLEWINVLDRLANEWKNDDYPWWYNERASVSTLAAAAWQAGGTAFEEYSAEKKFIGKDNSKQIETWPGRVDLFIGFENNEYVAEAKQFWPDLTNIDEAVNKLNESLNAATKDAKASSLEAEMQFAVAFAAPYISKDRVDDQLPIIIKKWINSCDTADYQAHALFFPTYGSNAIHDDDCYPGAALFIRQLS